MAGWQVHNAELKLIIISPATLRWCTGTYTNYKLAGAQGSCPAGRLSNPMRSMGMIPSPWVPVCPCHQLDRVGQVARNLTETLKKGADEDEDVCRPQQGAC